MSFPNALFESSVHSVKIHDEFLKPDEKNELNDSEKRKINQEIRESM